ncbi:RND multidrug efflux transporter; Acriflavin resistance protein [hydrothermal vent metagenome]|uniref:RND multidrug efflux transporter Acriflavin resistance protein n=1 Tax=hydrothermal vent metagenome TaxID=652676 RepID=A0A1W1BT31_9ZZZZ
MNKKTEYEITDYAGVLAKGFIQSPLTSVLGVFLLLMGYLALSIMPREEDPQIAISGGAIIVVMPGASPKEIENIIVNPLERKLREVRGIENVYGMSMENYGVVNVMYYIGENREDSNLKLYDKVMQNMDLMPKGVMQPLIKPFDIDIDIPIVTIAFYPKDGSNISDVELFKKVRRIQQKINAIDNVAKTTLKGVHKAQYNVQVDMGKLSAYHLSMGQIMKSVQSIAVNVPDVKGRTSNNQLIMFGVKNAIESPEDVGNVIVAQYMGSPIYLKDVAEVTEGIDFQNFKGAKISFRAEHNTSAPISEQKKQITLTVAKLAGTNAVFVSEDVTDLLNEYKEELSKAGIGYIITRNYGHRANEAVNELMHHLIITIGIIAFMLIFALGWRESLIVTFTVPTILAITLFTAYMTGQTMNRITLFALLLSLGLLVDAAIIVIENIHRHLHSHEVDNRTMDELLIEATDEIGAPTNVATLAIILTMVPMAFVGGMMGSFMKPIPYNVPVALIASLFVAYIFTPYLSSRLLHKPDSCCHETEEDENCNIPKEHK